jgi:hypothetical protein
LALASPRQSPGCLLTTDALASVDTAKVVEKLVPGLAPGRHVLLLVSHPTPFRNDTDREMPHRPESNFMYLTGCDVPGAAVTIALEVAECGALVGEFEHTLFAPPPLPANYRVGP